MNRRRLVGVAVLAALVGFCICWTAAVRIGQGREGREGDSRSERAGTAETRPAPRGGTVRLGRFDPAAHRAAHPARKGAPLRFAEATEVEAGPETHGEWRSEGKRAVWRLAVEAPGAVNLNLGFGRFALPESAALELRGADGRLLVRPFTAADNEAHGELWTPVVAGERVDLVLTVAEEEKPQVDLKLASINRGFRDLRAAAGYWKVGSNAPEGNCHIDVACSAAQSGVGSAIDLYRDQIRAAALYTLQGIDTCSGAAVNNTRNDGKPLFLTADHCGVRSSNAASMVVYWNFENSSCRTPGSVAAGRVGDGPVTDFNSGAIFRSTYARADTTLVELDDPIDPSHAVYLAGWSRVGTPTMGVAVHHPALSEKRISFDFDALQSTDDTSETPNPAGAFWRVVDWEFGSTEGGSSGSPLFDEAGLIVGLLSGGFAACGNNDSDWYGKLARAWIGGGTPDTRLHTWLDPEGTGATTLDGLDLARPNVTIGDAEVEEGDAGTTPLAFTVTLSSAADERVELTWTTEDDTAQAGSDYQPASGLPLVFEVGETSKQIVVLVLGDLDAEEHERFRVVLALSGDAEVVLTDAEAIGTILNDDYIPPVIVGPATVNGAVAQELTVTVVAQNTPTGFSLSGAPAGMTIDSGGTIRWVPSAAGDSEVTVTASNPAGARTLGITFAIGANPLAQALDVPAGVSVTSGGARSWVPSSSADSIAGGSRAASGLVSDDESSWLELTVEGPDYLGFWWKVSSEEEYDYLHFEMDGELRASISGTRDWEYQAVVVPAGVRVLRWTYEKDGSVSEGLDRGWVDFVQLASRSFPFLMEPPRVDLAAGRPIDYRFPVFRPDARFVPVSLPGGVSLNGEGELNGNPSQAGTYPFDLVVEQGGAQIEVPAVVEVHAATPLGDALGQPQLAWVSDAATGGDWFVQSAVSRDGSAAQERGVGDDEYAEMVARVTGPGELSFWWKVSSEDGYDGLVFELDGIFQGWISGEVDWTQKTIPLTYGPHRLSWYYVKDGSVSDGLDTAWVDQVEFGGYLGWALEAGLGARTNVVFDPDGDGQNLLFEYATGGRATAWDPMPGPQLVGGALEWSIAKPAGLSGVVFDAEVGSNLAEWNRTERTVLQDDAEAFRARDEGGGAERRFMRGTVHPAK